MLEYIIAYYIPLPGLLGWCASDSVCEFFRHVGYINGSKAIESISNKDRFDAIT
jgi:hypothetical protein